MAEYRIVQLGPGAISENRSEIDITKCVTILKYDSNKIADGIIKILEETLGWTADKADKAEATEATEAAKNAIEQLKTWKDKVEPFAKAAKAAKVAKVANNVATTVVSNVMAKAAPQASDETAEGGGYFFNFGKGKRTNKKRSKKMRRSRRKHQ